MYSILYISHMYSILYILSPNILLLHVLFSSYWWVCLIFLPFPQYMVSFQNMRDCRAHSLRRLERETFSKSIISLCSITRLMGGRERSPRINHATLVSLQLLFIPKIYRCLHTTIQLQNEMHFSRTNIWKTAADKLIILLLSLLLFQSIEVIAGISI